MLASVWSFLGLAEENPPPVTVMCVRIPADGSPTHLLRLTTTPTSDNVDCFLCHIPDFRQYWTTEDAWTLHDLGQIELKNQARPSCNGVYYTFFSYAMDDLPKNVHCPEWLKKGRPEIYWGDVFVVKLPSYEHDENGWAIYEDVPVEFLDLIGRK